jgi:hypothetical protein
LTKGAIISRRSAVNSSAYTAWSARKT